MTARGRLRGGPRRPRLRPRQRLRQRQRVPPELMLRAGRELLTPPHAAPTPQPQAPQRHPRPARCRRALQLPLPGRTVLQQAQRVPPRAQSLGRHHHQGAQAGLQVPPAPWPSCAPWDAPSPAGPAGNRTGCRWRVGTYREQREVKTTSGDMNSWVPGAMHAWGGAQEWMTSDRHLGQVKANASHASARSPAWLARMPPQASSRTPQPAPQLANQPASQPAPRLGWRPRPAPVPSAPAPATMRG